MISGTDERRILDTYARGAGRYDAFVSWITFGLQEYIRNRLVERLAPKRGDLVLDLACGTGLNFKALEHRVGPTGRIVGVDLSADMLAVARRRVEKFGWTNVTLIQSDVTRYHPEQSADAALSTFALGLLPDPGLTARRMVDMVRPGAPVLVADTQLVPRWYGAPLNPVFRLAGRPWIPRSVEARYWSPHPLNAFTAVTVGFWREEWLGGSVYAAWGRRPGGTTEAAK